METPTRHMSITVSRQMGSGGSYIGYLLAKELKFEYMDREILRRAAKHIDADLSCLEKADQKSSDVLWEILHSFTFGTPESAGMHPLEHPVYNKDLFHIETRIMHAIVDCTNAVIVSHGGFHALKDRPNVLHVFIHAPLPFRIERIMKMHNLSERKARAEIAANDRQREKFIREMTGVAWRDARNFHLCIDASVAAFPTIVAMIRGFAQEG